MSDLISRETVQAEINKCHITSGVKNQGVWNECVDSISRTIDYIPSADILECARAIKKYCEKYDESCVGCPFNSARPTKWCELGGSSLPYEWDLPEGEKE